MKGVLLLGGTGSRMYPLTKCINKHLLPIGNKPMAQWNIEKLVDAGINDILIISGREHCGSIIQQFGDGSDYNAKLTYKVQKEAGGIAEALKLAKDFANNDSICVILGDNISNFELKPYIQSYLSTSSFNECASIFLKEVNDPQRFGVAEYFTKMSLPKNRVIISNIVEKPENPKSNYAVTGFYIYPNDVFDRIDTLKYSDRGELEVTDLNMSYVKEHKILGYIIDSNYWWTDAGTFESYEKANKLIKEII